LAVNILIKKTLKSAIMMLRELGLNGIRLNSRIWQIAVGVDRPIASGFSALSETPVVVLQVKKMHASRLLWACLFSLRLRENKGRKTRLICSR